jgi:L-lysine 2,3-aminomutase
MGVEEILASVDREIALLKQVRALLSGTGSSPEPVVRKVGRPKKSTVAVKAAPAKPAKKVAAKKKRHISPEGRKRIAEAVKRRWEAQRKAASSAK